MTKVNGIVTLSERFLADVRVIIEQGRQMAYASVNAVMCNTYWHIGERIVKEEQQGNERAEYGKQLMKNLAKELTQEYGVSYSERNLWSYRRFYLLFNDIEKVNARVHNLTWSHFRCLLRVESEEAREWLLEEAYREQWYRPCFL